MTYSEKITVMLVDDSSVIRSAISRILATEPSVEIVSSVSNGQIAISAAKYKKPDIMILDVEMPVMDGLTALPEILKSSPDTKIIMCSSLTAKGADTTMKAMALGAVECLVKPSGAEATSPDSPFKTMLINLVKSLGAKTTSQPIQPAAIAGKPLSAIALNHKQQPISTNKPVLKNDALAYKGKPDILAIGSSTGGPKALFQTLSDVGKIDIPIVITQHMPATFTKILAEHITQQSGTEAHEGEEGMIAEAGKIYVAPGGKHMLFEKQGDILKIKLSDGPQESFCKPAVDPMMRSLIEIYGKKILCVILTGMGSDGLKGAQALTEEGGRVIAQDEETSVVWGMPGAVSNAGICSAILPIQEIGAWVKRACT